VQVKAAARKTSAVHCIATACREDGRPALALRLRWRRRFVDMAKEKSAVCSSSRCRIMLSMTTTTSPLVPLPYKHGRPDALGPLNVKLEHISTALEIVVYICKELLGV
jgi:hypothetical protein